MRAAPEDAEGKGTLHLITVSFQLCNIECTFNRLMFVANGGLPGNKTQHNKQLQHNAEKGNAGGLSGDGNNIGNGNGNGNGNMSSGGGGGSSGVGGNSSKTSINHTNSSTNISNKDSSSALINKGAASGGSDKVQQTSGAGAGTPPQQLPLQPSQPPKGRRNQRNRNSNNSSHVNDHQQAPAHNQAQQENKKETLVNGTS